MAEITVNRPEIFPKGTVLGIYPHGSSPGNTGPEAPTGAALQSKEVEDDTVGVTFTGLSAVPAVYQVIGKVGTVYRRLRVIVGTLGASLTPPAKYPGHKAR
jgi:hypothetical protein